ncbi:hypothetical protein L1049_020582 [Liquidambar formosana]|uniref:Uncharacterized protein n=1 Tax=Liquidambar formosana TaxID=63359 RepID=A0AAP0SCY0_LIQFO
MLNPDLSLVNESQENAKLKQRMEKSYKKHTVFNTNKGMHLSCKMKQECSAQLSDLVEVRSCHNQTRPCKTFVFHSSFVLPGFSHFPVLNIHTEYVYSMLVVDSLVMVIHTFNHKRTLQHSHDI